MLDVPGTRAREEAHEIWVVGNGGQHDWPIIFAGWNWNEEELLILCYVHCRSCAWVLIFFDFWRVAIPCNALCSTSSNALHFRWLGWTLLVTSKVFRFLLLTFFCPPAPSCVCVCVCVCACVCVCVCVCVCLCAREIIHVYPKKSVLEWQASPAASAKMIAETSSHPIPNSLFLHHPLSHLTCMYLPTHRLQQEGRNFIEIFERTSHGQGVYRTHWHHRLWSWEGFSTQESVPFLFEMCLSVH
jgi:hypothetical protein